MTSHRLHKSAGRKERVSPNFPLFFYCIIMRRDGQAIEILPRSANHAGGRFSAKSKGNHLGTCMRDSGFQFFSQKISPIWQISLFVKLTIRFIIFYNEPDTLEKVYSYLGKSWFWVSGAILSLASLFMKRGHNHGTSSIKSWTYGGRSCEYS